MRENFKGLPQIKCECTNCKICEEICPTGAIKNGKIDLGKCTFCLECERACPNSSIKFTTIRKILIIDIYHNMAYY